MEETDVRAVAAMLGRPPRGGFEVAARCHLGLPTVITVDPVLDDGTLFPTRHWLTCPLSRRRCSALESEGEISAYDAWAAADPEFGSAMEAADRSYEAEREARLEELIAAGRAVSDGPRPSGGVGGAHGGVKCLHARLAYALAGGADPVGRSVRRRIEPLDCTASCVGEGSVRIVGAREDLPDEVDR